MQHNVICNTDGITVEWLTTALLDSGALTVGAVASIDVHAGQANWSTNARLRVTYSNDANGTLPERLFLKMAQFDPDEEEAFGNSEVTYYTQDYIEVPNAPLIRCYDAAYSELQKRYHLLLDDVSDTHIVAAEKEPTLEYGYALAEGLASLHARWWGAERLDEADAPIHDAVFVQRFIDISAPGVDHFLHRARHDLEPHWPDLMRELYVKHPQAIIERAKDDNGFTLIHGDVNENNIMVPQNCSRPLYLIDHQPFNWSLTTWLGLFDLAYAVVLYWPTEVRRRCEDAILRRYHDQLYKNGVTNYSSQQLYDDYRLCVAMCVYVATEYCRNGTNSRWFHEWLLMLQRSLTTCDDLNCRELW